MCVMPWWGLAALPETVWQTRSVSPSVAASLSRSLQSSPALPSQAGNINKFQPIRVQETGECRHVDAEI